MILNSTTYCKIIEYSSGMFLFLWEIQGHTLTLDSIYMTITLNTHSCFFQMFSCLEKQLYFLYPTLNDKVLC